MSWSDRPVPVLRKPGVDVRPRPPRRTPATCRSCPVDQGIEHSAGAVSFARTRSTSIRRTSSSSPSRAAATPSPPRSACSGRSAGGTRTRSRSSSSSTTTSCSRIRASTTRSCSARRRAGVRPRRRRRRRDHLLRLRASRTRQIQEVSEAFQEAHELGMFTVLWCYLRNNAFKQGRRRLLAGRRPDRPGQPSRRHHRGRHHQAEAGREQRRLQGGRLRPYRPARLRPADHRPPDRPDPLAGRQLLHGPHPPHQQRRRVQRRVRPRPSRADRRDQQASRAGRPHLGPQGFPASHRPGDRACSIPFRTSISTRCNSRMPPGAAPRAFGDAIDPADPLVT